MPRSPSWPALLTAGAVVASLAAAPESSLSRLERDYLSLRNLRDALDIAEARGVAVTSGGDSASHVAAAARTAAATLSEALARLSTPSRAEDARALSTMRAVVEPWAKDEAAPSSPTPGTLAPSVPPPGNVCAIDSPRLAAEPDGVSQLRARTHACYGEAALAVRVGEETVDRLTVLSRLGQEEDPERRRRLFLSLAPVWRTMNGDGSASSPYRVLARAADDRWRKGRSPVEESAEALGIPKATLEQTLLDVLARWRDTMAVPGEPWDYWYAAGETSRTLAARVPRERLRAINDRFHEDQGADVARLGVQFDLDPRPGKTPVAFTTFGARPGGPSRGAVPWVFATYRIGGHDNLVELLHETGHAVHIAAIRTRPAFSDWPDSDPFTEALGDLLALEAYEPLWQQRYLGAQAPLAASLRAKYASVMLDICWALFEWRVHEDRGLDPNAVWTDLTREYLKITPHPELSWWAMRGQLVNAPGYMMNYAIGSLLAADLRARVRELRGAFSEPDAQRYRFLSEHLYRFGLERKARVVVQDFLGRPLRKDALLKDLERAGSRAH